MYGMASALHTLHFFPFGNAANGLKNSSAEHTVILLRSVGTKLDCNLLKMFSLEVLNMNVKSSVFCTLKTFSV